MQPADKDKLAKLAKLDNFFKNFDLQAAFSKEPPLNWEGLYTRQVPKPDDNMNSDEEPVIEEWMKPLIDLKDEELEENTSKNDAKKEEVKNKLMNKFIEDDPS